MLVDLKEAQTAFERLPQAMQLSTVSPAYCAADARRDPSLTPRFLLFRSAGALLLHSVHESAVPGGGTDWQSPYGYGGPIGTGLTDATAHAAWEQFDATATASGVIAEFVRFHPLVDNFRLYPGKIHDDRPVVAVHLGVADLESTYNLRGRRSLRKAVNAGLVPTWEDPSGYYDEFTSIYHAAMRLIGADDFYLFPRDYFAALFALPGTRVLVIRHAGAIVAAGAFLFGPQTAEYHLGGTTPEGRKLGAMHFLLHEAACTAQREGLTSLYLGGGTDSRSDNSLLTFKESFAPARYLFRFGFRILNPDAYEELRRRFPLEARSTGRVLFYRGGG